MLQSTTKKIIEANPDISNRKILFLYDCDAKKTKEHKGKLFVDTIPRNPNNDKVKDGIENLLPSSLFDDNFYEKKTTEKGDGGETIVTKLKKKEFCTYICHDRKNRDDFNEFYKILHIFDEFIGITQQPSQISR